MKRTKLDIKVEKPFGNLFRKKTALLVIETADGDFLVGAKPYQYPPTITRLLGGGVDDGESENDAAVREIREELGVTLDTSQLTPILVVSVNAEDSEGNHYTHDAYIYYVNIEHSQYEPGDDIKAIVKLGLDDLYALGEAYDNLPETLWYNGSEGFYSWRDYGKMYGPVHKLVSEVVRELKNNQ